MVKIVGLVLVFLCLAVAQRERPKCMPKNAFVYYRRQVPSKAGDVCYLLMKPYTWDAAKEVCRIIQHGNIADIPAADYIDFEAISESQKKFGPRSEDDLLWFGGRAVDGIWQWAVEVPRKGYTYSVKQLHKYDDPPWTPINYTNWENDQPPTAKDGQCIAVNAVSGKWQPLECEKKLPSACQMYTFF
ncbi:hypothetical protein AAVH_13599 [Aphelenchoides avenae]|nr:hypothetical protein AAVH_13599 [Aphelenchus avenae]